MEEKKSGKIVKILIVLVVILIIAVGAIVIWYNSSLSGTGTSEEKVKVEIPIGSSTDKIASILKNNNVIKNELAFKIYLKLNNVNGFQAGTYNISKDMDVSQIVQALQSGKVFKEDKVKITFVEGKTFDYVAKQIAQNTKNTEEQVYNLVKDEKYLNSLIENYWFITSNIKNKDIYYPLEGYLFPDTYSFEDENVTVEEIFKALLNKMEKVLETYKKDIQNSKYTVHQLLSVASVIENEAIFDKDRKDMSSVIYNRLQKKMNIGCDSTTYYAFKIELGERELYKKELNSQNPYNTRGPNMEGKLPVGPICMPSKESIEAAIYPNETNYLYFVTDNKGNAYYTSTITEHQKKINELKTTNAWAQF